MLNPRCCSPRRGKTLDAPPRSNIGGLVAEEPRHQRVRRAQRSDRGPKDRAPRTAEVQIERLPERFRHEPGCHDLDPTHEWPVARAPGREEEARSLARGPTYRDPSG